MTTPDATTKQAIDYARGLPAPGIFARVPGEAWALALVAVSACVGWLLNLGTGGHGPGPLFIPAVVAGVVWYVIARLRRRTATRAVWNVQLAFATLLCIGCAAFITFETDGRVEDWWYYKSARIALRVTGFAIVWFVLVELAALVDRRMTGYGHTRVAAGDPDNPPPVGRPVLDAPPPPAAPNTPARSRAE